MALMKCTACLVASETEEISCLHCGAALASAPQPQEMPVSTAEEGTQQAEEIEKPTVNFEKPLLAIPVVSSVVMLAWVARMNLLESPGTILTALEIATILGTAAVAATEAVVLAVGKEKSKRTAGPATLFIAFLLLWAVAYPVYLFRRKTSGLPNRVVAGIIIAIVFAASSFGVQYILDSRVDALKHSIYTRAAAESQVFQEVPPDIPYSPNDPAPAMAPMGPRPFDYMPGITEDVIGHAQERYDAAVRADDKMQRCVYAQIVSAAYAEAKDVNNARKAKETDTADCKAATFDY